MVANLLDNAVKYTPGPGEIAVILQTDAQKGVVLTVRDTGIGISEDHLPHIFDRFYRCDPSRSKTGNGLGLSLVQAIVKSYGGRLKVDSRPGKGSVFTVVLPHTARS